MYGQQENEKSTVVTIKTIAFNGSVNKRSGDAPTARDLDLIILEDTRNIWTNIFIINGYNRRIAYINDDIMYRLINKCNSLNE